MHARCRRWKTTMETTTIGQGEALGDIPFELVGKVASAGAVAKAGDVERGAAARHGAWDCVCDGEALIESLQ